MGQADGVHHTHIHAHEEQGEEVAHFLHSAQVLQTQVTVRVRVKSTQEVRVYISSQNITVEYKATYFLLSITVNI